MIYTDDEDAFMQLLKAVMLEHVENGDALGKEFGLWLEENRPTVDGFSYEDGPEHVRDAMRRRFVDETAYEERDDMMHRFSTEIELGYIERAWELMDEHEEDWATEYRGWAEANAYPHGMGYPKEVCESGRILWYDFLTDYGTRHVNEILMRYGE